MYKWFACTHFGAGSPSASHSIINGFSVSPYDATWKSISSAIGCLIIRGGECTRGGNGKIMISVYILVKFLSYLGH